MTARRVVVSVSVVAVALGLSACSSGSPSGVAPLPPSARGSSAPPPVSPTSTSKWTSQQQQVIDGFDGFNNLVASIWAKAEKLDMAKAHQFAKDPFATKYLTGVAAGLSAGFVQTGKLVSTVSSVTTVGDAATIKTCLDQTHLLLIDQRNPSGPRAQAPKPSRATVSLTRQGDAWLVSGIEDGKDACISG